MGIKNDMRVKFKLITKGGYAGDLHAFLHEKTIPHTGEKIKLNTAFSEGIFLPGEECTTEDESLKKDAKKMKQHLRGLMWKVTEIIKNNHDGETKLLVITVNEV